MNPQKAALYIHILGIAATAALIYTLLISAVLNQEIRPQTIGILIFSIFVMVKYNPVWQTLWKRWFAKK